MIKRKHINVQTWKQANLKLVPCILVLICGLILSSSYGDVRKGDFDHRLVAFAGVMIFLIFSIAFLHVLTKAIHKTIVINRLGFGRAASIQFILRLVGYIAILFTALDHLGLPVGRIILGSAVLGIILGVAAQQALANFFASIVLIIAHPFFIGQKITLISGGLGGKYTGTVIDIGLTHTHIKERNGSIVAMPNSALLTGATIRIER
jgi:small-conductance mechanosensitive channel